MTFSLPIPHVQLSEFDLGGVLYHANYFRLFERAREALLEAGGMPYPSLVRLGQHLAIAESHQKFILPIRYGDALEIKIKSSELKRTSVQLSYEIYLTNDATHQTLAHTAWTKLVFVTTVNTDAGAGGLRPARFSEELQQIFERHQTTT